MGSSMSDIDSGLAAANEGPQHRAAGGEQPIAVGRFEVTRDQYGGVRQKHRLQGQQPLLHIRTEPAAGTRPAFLPQSRLRPGRQTSARPQASVGRTPGPMLNGSRKHRQALPAVVGSGVRIRRPRGKQLALRFWRRSRQSLQIRHGPHRAAKTAGLPAGRRLHQLLGRISLHGAGRLARERVRPHDVIGNVWEWTEYCFYGDDADGKPYGAARGDGGLHQPDTVVRGGDWFSSEASLRPAVRAKANVKARHDDIGFRVARTLAP